MLTTVINVRRLSAAELLALPEFVYVGRAEFVRGWERSFWANPYEFDLSQVPQKEVRSLDQHSVRIEMLNSVVRFECSLRLARREPFKTMQARIGELKGKVLGCQCCTYDGVTLPVPWCHAASLAHFVNTWKGEGAKEHDSQ